MPNLFERAYELLAKSDSDPLFKQLIEDLEEQPEMQERPNGKSRLFNFAATRLAFVAHLIDERWMFRGAFMTVEPEGPIRDRVALHGGNLPNEIVPEDDRDGVRRKLHQVPIESKLSTRTIPTGVGDVWEDAYVLPLADLQFYSDANTGQLCYWAISMKKTEP